MMTFNRINRDTVWRYVLAVFSLILVVDGAVLLLLNQINFGTVLPFCLGLAGLVYTVKLVAIHQWIVAHRRLKLLWNIGCVLLTLWLMTLLVFGLWMALSCRQSAAPQPVAAIIVLGGGVEKGKPSSALQTRLDRATQWALSQPQVPIIVSGGLGFEETHTEAAVMADDLIRQGVAAHRIWIEPKSTSTAENFEFSRRVLAAHGIGLDQPIAVVSNDFHLPRSQAIAMHQGYLHPVMVGSPTPLSIRYNAWLREYFAFISGWILDEY